MTVQAWLIFTPSDVTACSALYDSEANGNVVPRAVDNDMADQQGYGTLVGNAVAPAKLLNDPDYTRYATLCSTLDIRTMDSDVLFVPWEV